MAKTKKATASKSAPPKSKPAEIEMPTKTTRQPSFKVKPMTIVIAVVIVLAGVAGYLYNRYWNVAVVNGHPISRIQYYKAMEAQAGQQVLSDLVLQTLINQEAQKKGVTVDQSTIDAQIATIENQMQAQGTTLDQELAAQGMSRDDLINQIKTRQLVQLLGKGNVQITDDQIDQYMKTNPSAVPTGTSSAYQRQAVKTILENQTSNQNIQTWLDSLKKTANITYN